MPEKFSYAWAAKLVANRKLRTLAHLLRLPVGEKMNVKGKTAIVTGASRGIGKAIAIELAKEGANVVLAARTKSDLDAAAKECEEHGCALSVETDVTKLDDLKNLVKQTKDEFGSIHVLVNNAGIGEFSDFLEKSDDYIRNVIDVNLYGLIALTRHALPEMKEGVVVNISSGAGKTGIPGFAAYCATKFGVIGFTEAVADEFDNVRFYAVCPGPVDTQLYRKSFGSRPSTKPEDVARVVVDTIKNPGVRSGGTVDVR